MAPVLPGSTLRDHWPSFMQPHAGVTSLNSRSALPVLVKMNSQFTSSSPFTLPKSITGRANWIFGPEDVDGGTGTLAEAGGPAVAFSAAWPSREAAGLVP